MNEPDSFDPGLAELFRQTHTQVAAEPFVRRTLARLSTRRARAALVKRVLQGVALAAVIIASPWLIAGSVWLSGALDAVLTRGSGWLSTPIGMAVAALLVALVALRWRWQR